MQMAQTAGGGEVPQSCVDALDEFEKRWPGASFPTARTGLAIAAVEALPYEIETRVRYIYNVPYSSHSVFTFNEPGFGGSPEEASRDPWMMQKCITWVEERKVYKTDWEVVGEDD